MELQSKCGVYLIVSPSNGRYVGSSKRLDKRFNRYKNYSCSRQSAILASLRKYGFGNHKITVLKYCDQKDLFFWERVFGDIYLASANFKNGLNITLPSYDDIPQIRSEEFKKRISETQKKRFENPEERLRTSISTKKGFTDSVKKEMSRIHKDRFSNIELRKERSEVRKNFYIRNPQARIEASDKTKSFYLANPERKAKAIETLKKFSNSKLKKEILPKEPKYMVINTITGEKYLSSNSVAKILKIPKQTFRNWLKNIAPNPTTYTYL